MPAIEGIYFIPGAVCRYLESKPVSNLETRNAELDNLVSILLLYRNGIGATKTKGDGAMKTRQLILLSGAILLLAGCNNFESKVPVKSSKFPQTQPSSPSSGSGGDTTSPPPVTFAEVFQSVFEPRCSGCHNSDNPKGGLDVTSAQSIASHDSVVMNDPDNSLLVMLIDAGDMPPPPRKPLTEEQAELVAQWILDGCQL
jgi:hypothetical protein